MSGERHLLGQPSRLVRQHNIQVPEILVTEEPDRDPEAQSHDPEKSEKFSWPQRSETLSKLPTEKLPPKKKRLRLAEMERSSTESSFDSTLSRSLSRDSSLSHTSSFSASFDTEDVSPKAEFLNKAEFLLIPPASNTLSVPGGPREMRRAASEQIGCVQASMEVSDLRSKSFDCGSVTPPRPAPLPLREPQPSVSAIPGHVPLLERRRGPLIRQISLNLAPEGLPSPAHPASTVPLLVPPLPEFPADTLHSQAPGKDLRPETANSGSSSILPGQQIFGTNLLNRSHAPLSRQNAQASPQVSSQGDHPGAGPGPRDASNREDCFAPKYQLRCQVLASGKSSPSSPAHALPNQALSNPAGVEHGATAAAAVLPSELGDLRSRSCPCPPLELGPLGGQGQKVQPSFVLPVPLHGGVPTYCFPALTPLPQILVTQDLSSQPICQANPSIVPVSEELNSVPRSQKDEQTALPNSKKELVCDHAFSEPGPSPVLESSALTPKMSVGRLSPQQESSASSKRMLSPANSLDIAMEKHQKRAKDENGAVCAPEARPPEPPSSRAGEVNKQKKPVLVRQVCTTEPLDGATVAEQGAFSQPDVSGSTSVHLTDVLPADNSSSGPVSESQEFESIKSPAPSGNSPLRPETTHVSPPQCARGDQERKSPGVRVTGPDLRQLPGTTLPSGDTGDTQQLAFPSLKTATGFTWCYLSRRKSLPWPQRDQRTSAYSDWTVSSRDPNPLGLPTKVALSLLNSKQKTGKSLYCQAITTHSKSDLLVYSSKWKSNLSKVHKI